MMEGRVLKLGQLEYDAAVWSGHNESGFEPLDDKTVVLVDEHVKQTSGGIALIDATIERQTAASEHGTVIAVGPAAFRWDDNGNRSWEGRRPKPGDRVYFERYAGQLIHGEDGRTYRLMSQRCIGAIASTKQETEGNVSGTASHA
jgi:chaperonin GroES